MNSKRNTAVIFVILCLFCFQAYAQNYVPGQVLVKMKSGKSMTQKSNLKHQMNASTKKTFSRSPLELWQIDNSQTDIEAIIQQYKNHPDIEYIEPNYIYTIENVIPDDPMFANEQWGLSSPAGVADINAPAAWEHASQSPDVKIGIIDTGIDWQHEDLAKNIWQNLGEDADGDGKVIEWNGSTWIFDEDDIDDEDNDGNGYKDDLIGWDFRNDDNNPMDDHSHGTHVAGIIGAQGDNGIGIAGVTWDVQMIALKVFGNNGSGSVADIREAIDYAVTMDIPITNNSWSGTEYSQTIFDAIEAAQNTQSDGTSMAAPHVVGACALMWGQYPGKDYAKIKLELMGFASANPNLSNRLVTEGSLNLYNWMNSFTPPPGGCRVSDSLALVALYNATSVTAAWTNTWDLSTPITNWYGVTLNNDKCVTRIELRYNNLNGTIPPEISYLEHLEVLNLGNNQLEGRIPAGLFDLANLRVLFLAFNQFEKDIPFEIGNLTNVTSLNLGVNNLSETIPDEIYHLPNLTHLHLSNNTDLLGTIPPEIGDMTQLKILNLRNTGISGEIPAELGDLTNLTKLYLDGTDLEGCYSPNLSSLCEQLKAANISSGTNLDEDWADFCNDGTGTCDAFQSCRFEDSLALMEIYDVLTANGWNSTWEPYSLEKPRISTWSGVTLNEMGCVIGLDLFDEGLTGSILTEIQELSHLEYLDISYNGLSDFISDNISVLSNLRHFDAYNSGLSGVIPKEIGELANLEHLDLANNSLTGPIPLELGDLNNLATLYLSYNELTGYIPAQLGNLGNLNMLALNNNELSGCYADNLLNLCGISPNSWMSDNNNFDKSWVDFCNSGQGCPASVWPGDMDNNGTVEKEDFLYWAFAVGRTGQARSDISTDWSEKVCADWGTSVNQVNSKHQDADGNGIVEQDDWDVIEQNYHQTSTFDINDIIFSDAQFFLEYLTDYPGVDESANNHYYEYSLTIQSDNSGYPIHGVACTVDFGMSVGGANFNAQNSSPDIQDISIINPDQNALDIALTRVAGATTGSIGAGGILQIVVEKGFLDSEFSIDLSGSKMHDNETINNTANSTFYENTSQGASFAPSPIIRANVRHANCDYPTGEIYLNIDGYSSAPSGINYSIEWDGELPANTFEITDVSPGVYKVTVKNSGATNTMTIEVEEQYVSGYDESGNPINCLPLTPPIKGKFAETDENSYLKQNYPNPFANTTTIPYDLPEDAKNPILNIFDVTGNLKYSKPITQTGKGEVQISERTLPAGIYYYLIKMDDRISKTQKMIIVK